MSTITLTAREFSSLVVPVIPHASTDVTLPVLNALRIRSAGDRVTAIATDRYRIGFQRVRPATPPEAGFDAVVPLHVLARLRTVFKTTRTNDPVLTLELDDKTLTVEAGDTLADGFTGATLRFRLPEMDYPQIDRLVRSSLEATPSETSAPAAFNPQFLADFRIGQPRHEPLVITQTTAPNKPWVIRVGEDFIGLLVPVRYAGGTAPAAERDSWLALLDTYADAKAEAAA